MKTSSSDELVQAAVALRRFVEGLRSGQDEWDVDEDLAVAVTLIAAISSSRLSDEEIDHGYFSAGCLDGRADVLRFAERVRSRAVAAFDSHWHAPTIN